MNKDNELVSIDEVIANVTKFIYSKYKVNTDEIGEIFYTKFIYSIKEKVLSSLNESWEKDLSILGHYVIPRVQKYYDEIVEEFNKVRKPRNFPRGKKYIGVPIYPYLELLCQVEYYRLLIENLENKYNQDNEEEKTIENQKKEEGSDLSNDTQKVNDEIVTFEMAFIDTKDYETFIKMLKEVDKPLLDFKGDWIVEGNYRRKWCAYYAITILRSLFVKNIPIEKIGELFNKETSAPINKRTYQGSGTNNKDKRQKFKKHILNYFKK